MASFERQFTLQTPSSTEYLAMIRDFVGSIGDRAGMTEDEQNMLALVVDEACSNVIEHSYGADQSKDVTVRAMLDDESIQIYVIDNGKGFDPSSVQQKDVKQLMREGRSGGLGMRLMRKWMDEVKYEIVPGVKNELRMVKRLKKAETSGSAAS